MGKRTMVVTAVVALTVMGLSCGRQQAGPMGPGPQTGAPGPQAGGPGAPRTATAEKFGGTVAGGEGKGHVLALTDADFDSKILAADKPAMVDFWAEWCGPCREQAPIVEAVAAKYAGKIIVGKLNVDEQAKTAQKYKIEAIPTLIFFKGGKEVERLVGLTPEDELSQKIEKVLLGQ